MMLNTNYSFNTITSHVQKSQLLNEEDKETPEPRDTPCAAAFSTVPANPIADRKENSDLEVRTMICTRLIIATRKVI